MSNSKQKKSGLKKIWSDFRSYVPFLRPKEAAWDDGTDDAAPSELEGGGFVYIIMALLGLTEGFFGCQYGRYLHQRYNCMAWGIPLTSRPVKSFGVATLVVDVVTVLLLAAAMLAITMLVSVILKLLIKNKYDMYEEISNIGLMIAVLCIVVTVIIMLFVPFNVFLIGIP